MTTLKFNEWQDVGGNPVMRINAGVLEVWDGSAWGLPTPGAAAITGTTGSPTVTTITDGGVDYDVYQFTGSGSITVSRAGFVDILVVGGGGGAAWSGGGAGGVLSQSNAYLSSGSHTIVVGAGGVQGTKSTNGISSRFGSYYGVGGGCSLQFVTSPHRGQPGGSGGGALASNTVTGLGGVGVSGQGNSGGDSSSSNATSGGGGAGAAGAIGTGSTGGNGGNGVASSITGSSVTYGGGGGGSGSSVQGTGGTGGGGDAVASGTSNNGTANTGGGGGGNWNSIGGSGGSGIVIVRVVV